MLRVSVFREMKGLNKTGFQSCWTLESCREKIIHNCFLFIVPFSRNTQCRPFDPRGGTRIMSIFHRLPSWFCTAVKVETNSDLWGLSIWSRQLLFKMREPQSETIFNFQLAHQLCLSLAINVCTDLEYKLLRKIVTTCSRSYLCGPEPHIWT